MRAYVIFSQEKYQALRMGNAYQVEQAQSNLNPSAVIIIKIQCQQKFYFYTFLSVSSIVRKSFFTNP